MELLWQLFWMACKIQHNRLKSPWRILCPVYSVHQDDFQRCRTPLTILTYNRSHSQRILACQSLPKHWKSHFQGPKFQKFSGEACPQTPLHCIPVLILKTLSIFGGRVIVDFLVGGWRGDRGEFEFQKLSSADV